MDNDNTNNELALTATFTLNAEALTSHIAEIAKQTAEQVIEDSKDDIVGEAVNDLQYNIGDWFDVSDYESDIIYIVERCNFVDEDVTNALATRITDLEQSDSSALADRVVALESVVGHLQETLAAVAVLLARLS